MINFSGLKKTRYRRKRDKKRRNSSTESGFKMNISQSNYSSHYDEDLTKEFKLDVRRKSKFR
jgi:hypothetical protein